MKKLFCVVVMSIVLAACGSKQEGAQVGAGKIEGTYVSQHNGRSFTFNADGTVVELSVDGKKIDEPFHYEVVGDQIKTPGMAFQFSMMKDGSINGGPGYGVMVKK
jgi:hypothetical protein